MENSVVQKKPVPRPSGKSFQGVVKRSLDIILSLILLMILTPVYVFIAAAIYIEDGGPVLFRQTRTGKDEKLFRMYKFRSMRVVMKEERSDGKMYSWTNGVPDDFVFKSCSEWHPDVTRVGRFIRKFSLDELPQLVNVLKGEMSMIGPRPEVPEITDCYSPSQKRRLEVKPGITGWAQVNGRSEINHGQKVHFDNHYVDHLSLKMDVKIFFLTILQVLKGKGAV
ncbi:glycosyl transferase [Salimicrobium jeotgali]|uniref:Glycosyl transferase n=1 Tax=Salimicrobium jeotgali TaxID=1230341 RepID=K2GAB6_9BACI|nr:sugar transferase [Salimicrobium jeotgali]AKG03798.1 glycosyl transferase [Salimicrobium jeotgali]EKE31287.1 sugar transferase [Salimicrobium jeotgali]MBM7697099.1 lipopolysaccharide/colanic/teichoic acid biosynthesis glycosyltransferase [Salimicrobium jeotgali]